MDFSLLASRVSLGLDGVRACLLLSSDGLTLGVHPEGEETAVREAWQTLQAAGDPQRGFVQMPDRTLVFARRGNYAALVVASVETRPGLILDKVEFLLRTADESRARESTALSAPAATPKPEAIRRPRSPLHREPKAEPAPSPEPVAIRSEAVAAAGDRAGGGAVVDLSATHSQQPSPASPERPPAPAVNGGPVPAPAEHTLRAVGPDEGPAQAPQHERVVQNEAEVDRVALAREFGRLLAEGEG
jgi:hypothetical protein